jgi:hypothetical protein
MNGLALAVLVSAIGVLFHSRRAAFVALLCSILAASLRLALPYWGLGHFRWSAVAGALLYATFALALYRDLYRADA